MTRPIFRCADENRQRAEPRPRISDLLAEILQRILGDLCAVPHGHNLNKIILDPAEKPIGGNDDLTVMDIRKFQKGSPGFGIIERALKGFLGLLSK